MNKRKSHDQRIALIDCKIQCVRLVSAHRYITLSAEFTATTMQSTSISTFLIMVIWFVVAKSIPELRK
jgi:hypothetical protein